MLQPAWTPTSEDITQSNIYQFMQKKGFNEVKTFQQWSYQHYQQFWPLIIEVLGIQFKKNYTTLIAGDLRTPQWLVDAKLNIIDSCFQAPGDAVALLYQNAHNNLVSITYNELLSLVNRVANSLTDLGLKQEDAIAIYMPMTVEAIAIYLGIIKMGGIVVSIADSFSADEIAVRLQISKAKAIFTQEKIYRGEKEIGLYEKVIAAQAPLAIVMGAAQRSDLRWENFLSDNPHFESVACEPMQACNILFSSGTTGIPKAIPWNHTTPIKVASDAFFHQNIKPQDVLTWPTNLGWMMGPWLVFAALINKATIAVYTDLPTTRAFGEFIEKAKVTMLGVVPTLVATWHQNRCMENLNWQTIKVFSSTGECSNAEDMLYLMQLGNMKPIIEYCGGTEIGGSYISSTVIQDNYPACFSLPAIGSHFVLLDEQGNLNDKGEVAIVPPAIGLSTQLINGDHEKIYFQDMPYVADLPFLRRHGDEGVRLPNGYYQILGRADDTMNLSGIKISAVEIERALVGVDGVTETAAVAITPEGNGPSQLRIYAVSNKDPHTLIKPLQQKINLNLNPLFKIYDVVTVEQLPKTASNKIMRRLLRNLKS